MDGISGAAAVIGLVQAATQVITALGRYVSRVREAESSRAKLLDQIRLITAAEIAISSIVRNSPRSVHTQELQVQIDEWVKEDGPPTMCRRELDELASWLEKETDLNKRRRWARKLGWPAKEDKIQGTIRVFEGYMPYFRDILSIKTFNLVDDMVTRFKNTELTAKKSELLSWLDGIDCTNKHESILGQRQQTTGDWLFREELYIDWRDGSTKFIWLHGKPGAGKSVLASAVIDELSNGLADSETLAYFYCDFRNTRCTSAIEVLRSVTKQLLWNSKSDWLASFSDLTSRKERGAGPPTTLDTLMDLLNRAAELHERPMIAVDALDECKDLANLLDVLTKLAQGRCRLFVTSRTLQIVEEAFQDLHTIPLDDRVAEIQSDIRLHIEMELESRLRLKVFARDLKDEIQGVLMEKGDGMFRWIQCQLDRLNDCYSLGDVREVLATLPATLYETYDQMLRVIDKKPFGRRVACKALKWLVLAFRPLRLSELAAALAIGSDKSALDSCGPVIHESVILEILGSLVSIDLDETVTLSHYSVKEYLTSDALAHSIYFVSRPSASLELVTVSIFCVMLLAGDSEITITGDNEGHRLSRYSYHYGFGHLADCHSDYNDLLVKHLLALQNHISKHRLVYERVTCFDGWSSATSQLALYIIIRFGHPSLLCHYLEHCPILATGEDNPLAFAALYGDVPRVEILLSKNLDVNLEGAVITDFGIRRMTPLTAAARNTREEYQVELVTLLIENGCVVPVDAVHSVLGCKLFTPCKPAVVRILLKHGADPQLLHAGRRSCLHLFLASAWKWVPDAEFEIVCMLVTAGCDPMAQDVCDISCFRLATMQVSLEFVQWLIQCGLPLPPNAILDAFSNYVSVPSSRNEKAVYMLDFLVKNGADAIARDGYGSSALHIFAMYRIGYDFESTKSVVRWLVEHGCNVNCKNDAGKTPLHLAAASAYFSSDILNLFLDQGAEMPVDIVNYAVMGFRSSPVEESHKITALTLLVKKFGASCQSWTISGDNALHCLLKYNDAPLADEPPSKAILEVVASLLVENGCDVHALNSSGETPLQLAIENGHFSVAQSISEWTTKLYSINHTTPYYGDSDGNSILHRLCRTKGKEFNVKVGLLREAGYDFTKDISRPNKKGFTPLCLALMLNETADDLAIVSCLLGLGASFHHVDYLDGLEWASNLSWYPDAIAAHACYLQRSKTTPEDVILVHQLLQAAHQGGLSSTVARSILNMAEYWTCTKVTRRNVQYTTKYDYEPIAFPMIPGNAQCWIPRRVVFACRAGLFAPRTRDNHALILVHVKRANSTFTVPIRLYMYCNAHNPPKVAFDVWDGFTPAERMDGKQRMMVEELITGDVLSVGFGDTSNDYFTLEFFRVEVYYAMRHIAQEATSRSLPGY